MFNIQGSQCNLILNAYDNIAAAWQDVMMFVSNKLMSADYDNAAGRQQDQALPVLSKPGRGEGVLPPDQAAHLPHCRQQQQQGVHLDLY